MVGRLIQFEWDEERDLLMDGRVVLSWSAVVRSTTTKRESGGMAHVTSQSQAQGGTRWRCCSKGYTIHEHESISK